nr:ScyD/ScyE family protein [Actinomycetales bacterium]
MKPRNRALAALGAGALILSAGAVLPAAADESESAHTTVADGLNNPRHLSFGTDGKLYVAESGVGGDLALGEGAEGELYFGFTGSVTRVNPSNGAQTRVLTGLPSAAAEDGGGASGPADVQQQGTRFHVSMGLGGPPEVRVGVPGAEWLGTFLTGTFSKGPKLEADLAEFEGVNDPDADGADSNPGGFVKDGSNYVIVDAGGNSLLRIRPNGSIQTIAVFPSVAKPEVAPGFMMDPVPTSVTKGPDGAYYVSTLTGFPFPAGEAMIWRVVAGQAPQVYVSGLTTVTDLAWNGSDLYAVQLGLLTNDPGSVVQVVDDGEVLGEPMVLASAFAPYGIAIGGGSAYVTTGSVLPGGGEVIRVALD